MFSRKIKLFFSLSDPLSFKDRTRIVQQDVKASLVLSSPTYFMIGITLLPFLHLQAMHLVISIWQKESKKGN